MEYIKSTIQDGNELAEIRASAMKPSLEALGRFDDNRVRSRFLDNFNPEQTFKIIEANELMGFYVVRFKEDHCYLDHLYIKPEHQNRKLGQSVVEKIVLDARKKSLPVRLGALRGSKSNEFYYKNGFVKTHEDDFDIYYEYPIQN